jgi:hypothetical protein
MTLLSIVPFLSVQSRANPQHQGSRRLEQDAQYTVVTRDAEQSCPTTLDDTATYSIRPAMEAVPIANSRIRLSEGVARLLE